LTPHSQLNRPLSLLLIACFQSLKGLFLLLVAAFLWIAPDSLPNSQTFTEFLYIAAHGKDLTGYLVPVFGAYLVYVGYGLFTLRPSVRSNLSISCAITIALSLQRLGLFGQTATTNYLDRETLCILILFDAAIYIYMVFHPEIANSFARAKRPSPLHS